MEILTHLKNIGILEQIGNTFLIKEKYDKLFTFLKENEIEINEEKLTLFVKILQAEVKEQDFLEYITNKALKSTTVYGKRNKSNIIKSYLGIDEEIFDDWLRNWNGKFPTASKTKKNRNCRSGFNSVRAKMLSFIEKSGYTRMIIDLATNNYIERESKNKFEYTQLSANFIEKDKVSTLEAECDAVLQALLEEVEITLEELIESDKEYDYRKLEEEITKEQEDSGTIDGWTSMV